jgi:uncharacterized protein with HEPN domain
MSRHDPKVTLRQVADHARRAQELCTQNTLPGMLTDWQKRAAFERIMEVLGEAVKRLPPELTARYPAVDWRGIAGMRDRVSHGYDAIDYGCCGRRWRRACPDCSSRSSRCSRIWIPARKSNLPVALPDHFVAITEMVWVWLPTILR